jgi:hypothetical protein
MPRGIGPEIESNRLFCGETSEGNPMNPIASRRRRPFARSLASVGCLLAISSLSPPAVRAEPASLPERLTAQTVDLLLLRPLGAFRLAAGAAIWVPISIVQAVMDIGTAAAAPLGESSRADGAIKDDALDVFVIDPARYVFKRPLGEDLGG